jgi:hypothetical protein
MATVEVFDSASALAKQQNGGFMKSEFVFRFHESIGARHVAIGNLFECVV